MGGGGDGVVRVVSFLGDAVGDNVLDSVDGVVWVLGDGVVVFGDDVVCSVVEVVVFGGGDSHSNFFLVGVGVPGAPGWGRRALGFGLLFCGGCDDGHTSFGDRSVGVGVDDVCAGEGVGSFLEGVGVVRFDEVAVPVVGEGVSGDDAPVSVPVLGGDVYGDFTAGDGFGEVAFYLVEVCVALGVDPYGDVFGVGVCGGGVVVCVYVAAGDDVSGVSGGVEGELCAGCLVEDFGKFVQLLHLLCTVCGEREALHVVDCVALFVGVTCKDKVVVIQVQGDCGVVGVVLDGLVCGDELLVVLDAACTNHSRFPFLTGGSGGLERFSQPHINMVPHF